VPYLNFLAGYAPGPNEGDNEGAQAETWHRVWMGRKNIFADRDFWMRFLGENFHFHAQNLWGHFLVIYHVSQILPIFFFWFLYLYCVECRMWPFFTKITPISENNSMMTPFLKLCSCFYAHPTNTILLKILGHGCISRPPTSNLLGGVPPVPPRSPPMWRRHFWIYRWMGNWMSGLTDLPNAQPTYTMPTKNHALTFKSDYVHASKKVCYLNPVRSRTYWRNDWSVRDPYANRNSKIWWITEL